MSETQVIFITICTNVEGCKYVFISRTTMTYLFEIESTAVPTQRFYIQELTSLALLMNKGFNYISCIGTFLICRISIINCQ